MYNTVTERTDLIQQNYTAMKYTYLLFLAVLLFSNSLLSQTKNKEEVKIPRGNFLLDGIVFPVIGSESYPALLLLRGLPGGQSDVFGIGAKLQAAGILTLTFSYSGTYKSEGEYSMEYTVDDIDAALDFLRDPNNIEKYNIDTAKLYLGGYSYGGGMSLTYAANNPEIENVFSIAGTDHGEFFRTYFANKQYAEMIDNMFNQIKAPEGPVRFEIGKMPKDITPEDVTTLNRYIDLRISAPLIANKNILLVAGVDDQFVTMENHILPLYRSLQNENAGNVKFVIFQDDHSFNKSSEEISELILHWIKM